MDKALKADLQRGMLEILNTVGQSVLHFRKNDGKAKRNARYFIAFVLHSVRLLVLTQSIDNSCMKPGSEIRLLLPQVLRRFESFREVFPQNAILLDVLKAEPGQPINFSHAEGGTCKLIEHYGSVNVRHEIESPDEEACANC